MFGKNMFKECNEIKNKHRIVQIPKNNFQLKVKSRLCPEELFIIRQIFY